MFPTSVGTVKILVVSNHLKEFLQWSFIWPNRTIKKICYHAVRYGG